MENIIGMLTEDWQFLVTIVALGYLVWKVRGLEASDE